jgi:hypothetical protein
MMNMDRKTAEGILDEMMNKPQCSRCAELEAALRKVDEIRHAMKAAAFNNDSGHLDLLVSALKAPCMEIYK